MSKDQKNPKKMERPAAAPKKPLSKSELTKATGSSLRTTKAPGEQRW